MHVAYADADRHLSVNDRRFIRKRVASRGNWFSSIRETYLEHLQCVIHVSACVVVSEMNGRWKIYVIVDKTVYRIRPSGDRVEPYAQHNTRARHVHNHLHSAVWRPVGCLINYWWLALLSWWLALLGLLTFSHDFLGLCANRIRCIQ